MYNYNGKSYSLIINGRFFGNNPSLVSTKIRFTYFWKTKLWPKTEDTNNKGHHKNLFQISVRDIYSEQELLFLGNSEAQEGGKTQSIRTWKSTFVCTFRLFVMCNLVPLSINSPVMALGELAGHQTIQRAKDDNRSQNLEERSCVWQEENTDFTMFSEEFIDKEVVTLQISGELLSPSKAAAVEPALFVWNKGEGLFPDEL